MRTRVDSAFRLLDNQMHRLCLVNFFAQARPSQPDFPEQRLNTTMIAERPVISMNVESSGQGNLSTTA